MEDLLQETMANLFVPDFMNTIQIWLLLLNYIRLHDEYVTYIY